MVMVVGFTHGPHPRCCCSPLAQGTVTWESRPGARPPPPRPPRPTPGLGGRVLGKNSGSGAVKQCSLASDML